MKLVDIDRVVILMRFIQHGWNEEKRKSFDENLKKMLETQAFDMEEHDKQIRVKAIDEFAKRIIELNDIGEISIYSIADELKEQIGGKK